MEPRQTSRPLLQYDAARRRLWVFGQRAHHGAGGALIASAALTAITLHTMAAPAGGLLLASGSALMAHDWKDRELWFQAGFQNQP